MLIDSHAHLNFEEFNDDYQQVISDCQNQDVWMINVGSQFETSKKAVEIAEQYDKGVYAAVGLHPIHVQGSNFQPEKFNIKNYKNLITSSKKVKAIGESGLDFFHSDKNFAKQKEVFIQHLDLAKEFDLPIILHSRNSKDGSKNAYEEILEILKILATLRQAQGDNAKGVIHCYGGTLEQAKKFLDLGFHIGFTGVITFPKTDNLAEIVRIVPMQRFLIETDCPFLAPQSVRGERNLPQYVKHVAEKIAEIRQISYNKVVEQTAQNAIKLFDLD